MRLREFLALCHIAVNTLYIHSTHAIFAPVPLHISPSVRRKLAEKHNVTEEEIRQCFYNLQGTYLRDLREEHHTDPPTYWFISETNRCRSLKVVFIARSIETSTGSAVLTEIKTAFPPDAQDTACWQRHGSY